MDANLFFPAATTAAALSGAPGAAPDAAANPLAGPLKGADFANVLGNLMGQSGRQELAAAGLAEVGLKALPLGPQIQVITAAEPLPDAASLVAFARSQGLDESTVTALFGTAGAASFGQVSASASGQASLTTMAALGGVPAADGQALPLDGAPLLATAAALALNTALPGLMQGGPDARLAESEEPVTLSTAVSAVLPGGLMSAASLAAWGQRPGTVWQDGAPAPGASSTGLDDPSGGSGQGMGQGLGHLPPAALVLASLNGAAAPSPAATPVVAGAILPQAVATQAPAMLEVLNAAPGVSQIAWQLSRSASAPVGALAGESATETQEVSAATAAATSDLMQEAVRLRLQPHEALTRRLAELSGTGQNTVWAALAGSNNPVATQARLDLSEFAGVLSEPAPLDAAALETQPSTTGVLAEAARTANTPAGAAPAGPLASQQAERVAHYEQLAERLGQALAQRLQAQIERGEWKVQMRLDPGQLGQIQLELDMHAGGLDAVFRSDNQVTRDLITQGMSKLRDSLSQSGTTVANVWVQSDSQRQSGGNPTPQHQPQGGGTPEPLLPVVNAVNAVGATPVARVAQATDGLDLLA